MSLFWRLEYTQKKSDIYMSTRSLLTVENGHNSNCVMTQHIEPVEDELFIFIDLVLN